MNTKPIIIILALCSSLALSAQTTVELYYLQFDTKDYSLEDNQLPIDLEKRRQDVLPIDSLDYPVREAYLNILCCVDGIRLRFPSRWLNGVVVEVKERKDSALFDQLAFVTSHRWLGKQRVKQAADRGIPERAAFEELPAKLWSRELDYGAAKQQNQALKLTHLHKQNFLGQGIKVAIFDAGFLKANRLPAFAHLTDGNAVNGELKWSQDLVDEEANVWDDDDHGLHVLSCMGAWDPSKMIGTAPFADYYLFRTENAGSEYVLEEYYWLRAAELADSLGIDLINSSLGYNEFDASEMDYTHADLDGKTSVIAKAAQIAVQKGIIVVNAAGNEGNKSWKTLISPADVQGVISVGAVDRHQNTASFSSFGPTADGRIKPDVVALGVGTSIAASFGGYYQGNGTSYAAPILSGALACLLQKYPDIDPPLGQQLIRKASNRNQHPDNFQGWGLPNMKVADFFAARVMGKQRETLMPLTDTIHAELPIAVYHEKAEKLKLKLYQRKKMLGFLPFRKTIHKESANLGVDNMFYRHLALNRYAQQGQLRVKIVLIDPKGEKVKIAQNLYNQLDDR